MVLQSSMSIPCSLMFIANHLCTISCYEREEKMEFLFFKPLTCVEILERDDSGGSEVKPSESSCIMYINPPKVIN